MNLSDYHERELGQFRERFEAGYFPALLDAFQFCVVAEIALPLWLAEALLPELIFAFQRGGGKRGAGSRMAQAKHFEKEEMRHATAELLLNARADLSTVADGKKKRFTREDAFEVARQMLADAKSEARTSANEIRKSHAKVRARKPVP